MAGYPLETVLLAILHGLAAGAVTLHVLLTHREVRSSIGWIGLAWLSPILGSFIYLVFGINRVARRASLIRLAQGESGAKAGLGAAQVLNADIPAHIALMARAGDALAELPLTRGNTLELFRDGDGAYPAMLKAIHGAQRSIVISSYIYSDDDTARAFSEALIDAHKRGVKVRVLLDGIGSGYFYSRAYARLKRAGVPAAQFLHEWLPWKMSFINLRNHRKILVVDGKVGFTGGINIDDDNVSRPDAIKVQDIHAQVTGPIVGHLMLAFARDWMFTTGERLEGDDWWPMLMADGPVAMRGIASGPDESVGRIEAMWSTAIERAETRVRILTPYFLPEDRMLEVLRRAALRGVSVQIVVPERSNHIYFDWAMRAHLSGTLDLIECHLTSDPFDHSKLVSVDGCWSAFGSPNWDARSMRLNFELMVECYGTEATAAIDAVIDSKMAGAKKLTQQALARRILPVKLRDACARLFLPYL